MRMQKEKAATLSGGSGTALSKSRMFLVSGYHGNGQLPYLPLFRR